MIPIFINSGAAIELIITILVISFYITITILGGEDDDGDNNEHKR